MKHFTGFGRLFYLLLLMGNTLIAKSQTVGAALTDPNLPIIYLGIDFTQAKLLDIGNPTDIRDRLYASINQVVIDEPKKYDLAAAFKKSSIDHDFSAITKSNAKINADNIISTNQADFNRLKEKDIIALVKTLDLPQKDAVGVLFVMEAMRKLDKKGTSAVWVTFISLKTKKLLLTERMESKASAAFGFRNYWASTIKNLIDDIGSSKYHEWKMK